MCCFMEDDEFMGAIVKNGPHQSLFLCNERLTNFQQNSQYLGSIADVSALLSSVKGSCCYLLEAGISGIPTHHKLGHLTFHG